MKKLELLEKRRKAKAAFDFYLTHPYAVTAMGSTSDNQSYIVKVILPDGRSASKIVTKTGNKEEVDYIEANNEQQKSDGQSKNDSSKGKKQDPSKNDC